MKTITAAVSLFGAVAAKEGECKALALSGGGSNGAWEAGVLWGFINYGNPSDFEYEVVSGVSAGALNTMGIAGWEIGKEAEMTQWLSDMWHSLHTSDVWQDWKTGRYDGWFIMGGALDNSPLVNYVQKLMAPFPDYKRKVTIASVEVNEGVYTEFDQTNTAWRDLPTAAICSSSIPGAFPPHTWKGRGIFMDGGTVYNINLEGAIQQCIKAGYDESQIVIDALFCGAPATPPEELKAGASWENYMRARGLRQFDNNSNSIAASKLAHPDVQLRYVLKQLDGAGGTSMLNFEGDFTWPLQTKGMQNAKDALSGKGYANIGDFITEWATQEEIRGEFATAADYIEFKENIISTAEKFWPYQN